MAMRKSGTSLTDVQVSPGWDMIKERAVQEETSPVDIENPAEEESKEEK